MAALLGKFVYEIEQMPAFELAEWDCFLAHEPHGERRADIRHGIALDVLAKVNGNKQSSPEDFIAKFEWPQE